MSVSINTSEYIKTKKLTVDKNELFLRPMSSAEQLRIAAIGSEVDAEKAKGDKADTKLILDRAQEIMNIYFELFTDPDNARKSLGMLEFEDLLNIYNQVMKEGEDGKPA